MRRDLPSGTVTFLFTDVEGSTRLLHELGAENYAAALAEHRRVIREACAAQGGIEVDTQGDAFFFAFPTAPGALGAAGSFAEALASGPIQVRVGLHTGTPLLTAEGYIGSDVHKGARIAAAGHGGQVLVSASTASLVETQLTDLGEHRLKDLSAPERIFQLADGGFPPLKTLYRTNLPVPATPFLGREAELADVVELLTGDGTRLLTLTGPGGTGKTRLALQAAAQASESFPDGVFWVPLAPLRDPELVLPALARTLAVSEEPGTLLEETLVAHLSGKTLLLLLDNVEHLLPPAAQRIAALRASNGSCLLVTSRERLRIGGEQAWPVPPLAEADGTALFLARARAVDPTFTPSPAVDELCARLDELPLAIELAAARTAVFSAEQLLERLSRRLDLLRGDRDADPRQQTLRATIEWSHELLSQEEQRLFARLAVFAGGCTYEAAEEVAGADPDTLQSLIDKSLLRKRDTGLEPRYWMLETIREFAGEQLEKSSEADGLRVRHAGYFIAQAESLPREVSVSREWLDRMEIEHDNVRAALERLIAVGETQMAVQLAGGMWRLWAVRGYHTEGMSWLDQVLAADASPTAARASALTGAVGAAVDVREYERGRLFADEALALYSDLEDDWGIARANFFQGYVAIESGDPARAQPPLEDALRRFAELGAEHDVQLVRFNLSWAYQELGDLERARELAEELLQTARATGNVRDLAFALDLSSSRARDGDQFDDAIEAAREGLRIRRDEGDVQHMLDGISRVAAIHARAGHVESAARLLSSSLHLHDERGMHVPLYQEERNEATLELIRATLDEAAFAEAWERGTKLTLDEAVTLALGESVEEGDEPVASA
ncbi:MAG: ATP-binding protein [Gaiellaceae bacterium]